MTSTKDKAREIVNDAMFSGIVNPNVYQRADLESAITTALQDERNAAIEECEKLMLERAKMRLALSEDGLGPPAVDRYNRARAHEADEAAGAIAKLKGDAS